MTVIFIGRECGPSPELRLTIPGGISYEMVNEPFVTRRQAQVEWRISRSSLLRAEKTCLKAERRERGEVYYARHEVEALAAKMRRAAASPVASMTGEEIAAVFALLDRRVSLADIVIQKSLHPDVVESIAARWRRMKVVHFILTHDDVYALFDAVGFEDYPTVSTYAKLLEDIRKHRAEVDGRPTAKPTPRDKMAAPATSDAAAGEAPSLADLLSDLTEGDRASLLSNKQFLAAVEDDMEDLAQGDLSRPQVVASIERGKARALKALSSAKSSRKRRA